jgi:hypothetical protein
MSSRHVLMTSKHYITGLEVSSTLVIDFYEHFRK